MTTEDSPESEGGTEPTAPAVTTEDSAESPEAEKPAEPTTPEVASEDSQESEEPAEPAGEAEDGAVAEEPEESSAAAGIERRPSRLGRGWKVAIAVALVLCAGGIGFGGYRALVSHKDAQAIARNDAEALKAAVDCVSATQAPDTNAMAASERKIIDCGTDAFRSQALLYTGMIVQAYQAANVHVQVADVRAAVERNNSDGSVDVLVALRVKVDSAQQQNETGYRLRVKMALAEGQYRISKLDQVTK
uniref:Mce protein n=1 Tax=Mycobacterium sp. Marseille-P9652 TaxID=2654950 RepID=UPI0012E81D91